MSFLSMGPSSIILYVPLILQGFIETAESAKAFLDRNPSVPFGQKMKETFTQGIQHKGQFIEMRSDFEVYIGLYLIIGWFIGQSNILQILIFWQITRMRYMTSYNVQAALRRLDIKISGYTQSPSCPQIIRTIYIKIKNFMASMSDAEAQARQAQSGGSLFSRCDIF